MNPLYAAEKFGTFLSSADAFAAIDERYAAAMLSPDVQSWAADLGDVIPTDALTVRLPIANLTGWGYQQTQGENRFKSFSGKYVDLATEEFDEGYEEYLLKLQKDPLAARQWAVFGDRLPMLETELVNGRIGSALINGETTNGIDGASFFSTAHGNLQTTATPFSVDNLMKEASAMSSLSDANGRSYGIKPDTIVVPNALYYPATLALSQSLIISTSGTSFGAVDNPLKGSFRVVSVNDLPNNATPANSDWYLLDSSLVSKGLPPWVIARMAVDGNLGLRRFDTDSDFFKNHSRIKVSSHVFYGFSLGFHHGLRKIKGA
jgi:hypothetical protein